mgnify:CR=1 FL=1
MHDFREPPPYLKCHISKCQKFPESRFKVENRIEMDSLTPPEVEKIAKAKDARVSFRHVSTNK